MALNSENKNLLEWFLEKFVEGYLYHDLLNMSQIWPKEGEHHGAAGYPMIMTTLSGMELLGGLMSSVPYKPTPADGNRRFLYYWDNYMTKVEPKYTGEGKRFREMIRHGLAHNFLTAVGIGVTKGNSEAHLQEQDSILIVDCNKFFSDFWESYIVHARPMLDKDITARDNAIKNVALILKSGKELHDKYKTRESSAPEIKPNSQTTTLPPDVIS